MGKVINEIVKMDWEQSGWLQTKGAKGKQGTFIFASKMYPSTVKGVEIPVFFTTGDAFLWVDDAGATDEDIWSVEDLKDWCKTEYSSAFPYNYDQYISLTDADGIASEAELEEWGIAEFKEDIEKRLADLGGFGQEFEVM